MALGYGLRIYLFDSHPKWNLYQYKYNNRYQMVAFILRHLFFKFIFYDLDFMWARQKDLVK